MATLGDPQVREFLSQGTRTGKLAYLTPSGRPLVAPAWFIVESDNLVFNTGSQSAKGLALARDPRVTLCVDLQEPPYGFVQVQGEAELSQDPAELLRPPPRSRRGTWAPSGPPSSASAIACPASWWCGCGRSR